MFVRGTALVGDDLRIYSTVHTTTVERSQLPSAILEVKY